ncbi:protein toll-like [Trichoplusia ni]|uniref:Protein toll-like n=1 Tax=Trichoplusia ni TaxID=7111 RepID=A0A7E5VUJ9_TRINI|nr:protein toll-like [Trichoplusia ni]
MYRKVMYVAVAALTLQIIGAAQLMCPSDPNCVCGGTLAVELNCNIDGRMVTINLLPNIYINIKCENASSLDYSKLPKCANEMSSFKSVSFKDCPLPSSSFKEVLSNIGVSKTMALIFQNAKNLSGYFDRKHFAGLDDLTKLLLSINGVTRLPDNLFVDINKLTWLNIRSNTISLSEELFKPLEKLETLEISHNHMTNISSNLFSHLSFLRKLSLWQSNVTWFSKDLFNGVDVLEELDLSSNGLNELPASIFKPLRKLKKLTLFSNKFSSLPNNLFKNNGELETVVILNNDVKLKELPKYLFGDLPNLRQIYIQRSGLETVPHDVFANSPLITNISLAYNDITTLPEDIFNDQINLLELDLSYNKITELKPKLFSSLVRLERLNLCHNSLVEISGQTFSSLLSLIDLEMEHNNLKTISSYLFSNNKQHMSISLAYNQLDFEGTELINDTWQINKISPFAETYNLKLLNLSHNEFKVSFKDWWVNGHENIDVSYNNITNPMPEDEITCPLNPVKKPMTHVWLSENPLSCECPTVYFVDLIQNDLNMKIVDDALGHCGILFFHGECYTKFYVIIILMLIASLIYLGITVYVVRNRPKINAFLKKRLGFIPFFGKRRQVKNAHKLNFKYCDKDEEFVRKEIFSVTQDKKPPKLIQEYLEQNRNERRCNSIEILTKVYGPPDTFKRTTIVIFSSNYLTTHYSHVDIKKIHSEMLKMENTIFVFVDNGSEDSIYAFLKEQRDVKKSIVWDENDFWDKLIIMISEGRASAKTFNLKKKNIEKFPSKPVKNTASDNELDSPTHSQV